MPYIENLYRFADRFKTVITLNGNHMLLINNTRILYKIENKQDFLQKLQQEMEKIKSALFFQVVISVKRN